MFPISVVILSHNRLEELSKNLPPLLSESHDADEFQIIVVDNNSTDGSREFLVDLQKKYPEIILILNERNLGVGGGRNSGFRVAQGEIFICLDDDAYLAPDQFGSVGKYFSEDSTIGALSMAVIHGITGESQNPHGGSVVEVANYHGAAHALRRRALERIGFLDDECFYGGEELDSCIRLHNIGYRCLYIPDILARHYSISNNRGIELERLLWWTYNYTRVLFKSFPMEMARLYSRRLLVARIFHGVRSFGVAAAFRIVCADKEGQVAGIRQHCAVGERTVALYRNESLRPELGNVPLWRKVLMGIQRNCK